MTTALPCPFCGEMSIELVEGTTFRWMLVRCQCCGASGPEARVDTLHKDRTVALERAAAAAIDEWNQRKEKP